MEDSYFLAFPERSSFWKSVLSVILPRGSKLDLMDGLESIGLQMKETWKMRVSLLLIIIIKLIARPLKALGFLFEYLLNLFSQNGGVLRTPSKLLNGSLIIPKKNSETFLSFIGHLVGNLDLYVTGPRDELNKDVSMNGSKTMNPGDVFFADVSAMASTIAYENELVIKKWVERHWKMHFVEFYDCWNDYLQKKATQAFICCDKEKDAKLIVIAFRGTEAFEADDLVTDLDFSWYDAPHMGKVHIGFLEALGLANRSNDKKISFNSRKQDPDKQLAFDVLYKKLKELLLANKNAKFIVTGHSLGGALAVLFIAMLVVEDEKLLEKLLAVYTFGQPRVGDSTFAEFMDRNVKQAVPRYFRVVYSNDLVPRIPFEDGLFMFKHFGVCLYFNSFYSLKYRRETPNRNFSPIYFIAIRIVAIWELLQASVLHYRYGKEFKETKLSIFFRILGILAPGLSAHSPVNYIHAVRLGPPILNPSSELLED